MDRNENDAWNGTKDRISAFIWLKMRWIILRPTLFSIELQIILYRSITVNYSL